ALADKLSNAGAEVSKVSLDIDFEQILAAHRVIMTVEGAFTHKCNFAARPEDYLPEVRKIIETGNRTSAVSYVSARNAQRELKSAVERVLEGYDLLLSPTAVSGAPTPETTGQPVFQAPWTMAGIPSISLPYSLDVEGMPLGAQLAGKFLGESSLLATAAWVENIVEFRKVPNIS
ncbi:MAG: amidase family protein, partial [Chloroflexota bacterium]|nr:amidase family protein [Chloroflexota bacterium]